MNRLKRIKIDEQNISELLRQIILTIPNLKDEIGSIIGVQLRYLPKNDSFQTMNDIGQAMTETIISVTPDNTVGIRKANHVLHTIYAPKIYPILEKVDLIVPVEILQTYGTLFQTDIIVIRYIFSLLHELGHIQLGITRPGHPAELLLAISDLMDAFDEYEHENYEVSEDNMRRRYRENYAELYADSFAYK